MSADRASEAAPVQVYLDRTSRERLDRLAANLDTTKSDILRRGLLALERELTDPGAHPALRLVGAAATDTAGVADDVAREHDRALAHLSAPRPAPATSRTKRRRG